MAAAPPPQPDAGSQPQPQGGPQANPLQVALGNLIQVTQKIAEQNPVVQPEMQQVRQACIQALQKTMMAARPEGQPAPAPPAGQ